MMGDVYFLANFILKFGRYSKWLMAPRVFMASTYFLGVFFGGEEAFKNATDQR